MWSRGGGVLVHRRYLQARRYLASLRKDVGECRARGDEFHRSSNFEDRRSGRQFHPGNNFEDSGHHFHRRNNYEGGMDDSSSFENVTPHFGSVDHGRNNSNSDERELALQLKTTIRQSLAEDADDGAATFYKPDGRLVEIVGEMDEEWQPTCEDEQLVLEMVELFKQGNVAAWEAEDIVRSHGGLLRPYHVFEVLKACSVEVSVALAFFRWAGLQRGYEHGTSTYTMMIKLLQEKIKFREIAEISKEMDDLNVPKSGSTYRLLLGSFFRAGMIEEALETFSQMEGSSNPPRLDEYARIMKTMISMECYPVIPLLFEKIMAKGHLPDAYMFNAAMLAYCNMAKMDEAFQVFQRMKSHISCDIHSYTILIDGYIKCYQVQKACDLFMLMVDNGCLPGEEIFNLLFGLHAKSRKLDQAVGLFRKLVESGCQPTVKSYGMLFDAFSMMDNIEGAYDFFRELIDKGFYPSIVVCNTLLGKLKRAGKTVLALKFYGEMKKFPASKPSAITYNIAIDIYGMTGKFDEAWNTFEEMKANGCVPCLMTYNNLIVRLGRGGGIEACFNLFEEMKARDITPNQYTYCGMIDVLVRCNQLQQALHFLNEMRSLRLQPHATTLQILIKCLWTSGNMGAARQLCDEYPGVFYLDSQPWHVGLTGGGSAFAKEDRLVPETVQTSGATMQKTVGNLQEWLMADL